MSVLAARAGSVSLAAERSASSASTSWRALYRVAGAAALGVVALVPLQMVVFFLWPPPVAVVEWFTLLRDQPLVGLLDLDLLMIVDFVLMAAFFLGLYAALHREGRSVMALALVAELLAVAAYFASIVAFEMLAVSEQYWLATTEAQRAAFLAVGQLLLATWQGTAFDVGYVLSAVAALLASVVMLRSSVFGRVAAVSGIVMGAAALVPPTVGTVGLVLSLVSLVPMLVWLFVSGRRLLHLGAEEPLPSQEYTAERIEARR